MQPLKEPPEVEVLTHASAQDLPAGSEDTEGSGNISQLGTGPVSLATEGQPPRPGPGPPAGAGWPAGVQRPAQCARGLTDV